MKKRLWAFVLSCAALMSCIVSIPQTAAAEEEGIQIYVSPAGSDSAAGTKEQPLASLKGAKEAASKLKGSNPGIPITVNFMGGVYKQYEEVVFTEADSGTDAAPITYRAYNDEPVYIEGSVPVNISSIAVVQDQKTLARMPQESWGRVGVVDLKPQGITGLRDSDKLMGYMNYTTTPAIDDVQSGSRLFVDNEEGVLARYPNYDKFATVAAVVQNPVFKPTDDVIPRLARWETAEKAYLGTDFGTGWLYESLAFEGANASTGTIRTEKCVWGVKKGERWQIINLLEELDAPGEYFIDTELGLLYYYPDGNVQHAAFEISTGRNFARMTNVSNINFKNINFAKTCGTAFWIDGSNNLGFYGCDFKNLGGSGIIAQKTTNMTVLSCNFADVGIAGVSAEGGDYKTLTPSNNRIENSTFINCAKYLLAGCANVNIWGVGASVEHNVMGKTPAQAIWHRGNDNKIRYNELFDVGHWVGDGGAMYNGSWYAHRGTEIAYNFINGAKRKEGTGGFHGIYLDDMSSGLYVHHNVVNDTNIGILVGGGRNHIIDSNIVCNANVPLHYDTRGTTWATNSIPGMIEKAKEHIYEGSPYAKYPDFMTIAEDDAARPKHATVTNNLFYKGKNPNNVAADVTNFAKKFENNIAERSSGIFVDEGSYNFEINPESEIASKIPSLLEVDFDKIGLYTDEYRTEITPYEVKGVKLIAPANETVGITNEETKFEWRETTGATSYELIIANDREMTDVVYRTTTLNTYAMVEGLPTGLKILYWQVRAFNKSKQIGNSSYSDVYAFQTSEFEVIDKTELEAELEKASSFLVNVIEGDNPGEFAPGSKDILTQAVSEARNVYNNPKARQKEINAQLENLNIVITGLLKAMNVKYIGIENMVASADNWVSNSGEVTLDGNVITNTISGATFKEKTPTDAVLCFRMKAQGFSGAYMCMGFNQEMQGDDITKGGKGYMFCLTSSQIEAQKWTPAQNINGVPNTMVNENTWYEVQAGVTKVGSGVRIYLSIDGEVFFDYIDYDALPLDGYFGLGARGAEENYMSIAPSENVPQSVKGSLEAAIAEIERLKAVSSDEQSAQQPTEQPKPVEKKLAEYKLAELIKQTSITDGYVMSENTTDTDSRLVFEAELNPGNGMSGIAFRQDDNTKALGEGAQGYMLVIRDDIVAVKRYKGTKETYVAIVDNDCIKRGENSRIEIETTNGADGVNITVKADKKEIISCTDEYGIKTKGYAGVYCKDGSKAEIK